MTPEPTPESEPAHAPLELTLGGEVLGPWGPGAVSGRVWTREGMAVRPASLMWIDGGKIHGQVWDKDNQVRSWQVPALAPVQGPNPRVAMMKLHLDCKLVQEVYPSGSRWRHHSGSGPYILGGPTFIKVQDLWHLGLSYEYQLDGLSGGVLGIPFARTTIAEFAKSFKLIAAKAAAT